MNLSRCSVVLILVFVFSIPLVTKGQNKNWTETEVIIKNGTVALSGTSIIPQKKEPVPAVVFLHGSGPMTRDGFRSYAQTFAELGIASVFYDKRGTGESGGSWVTSSLDDLANDALAAVEYLNEQPNIDAERIGFWGVSQAGWVASKAAAKSEMAFMIIISGGGASPRESEIFSYKKQFAHMGLSDVETADGLKVVNQYFDYLSGEMERDRMVEILEELANSKLSFLKDQLLRILPSKANRANWSWVADYEPAEDITQFKGSVLLMFGDMDMDQPTELALEKWKEGLTNTENEKVTISIFPGAAHGIRLAGQGQGHGHQRAPFADGYMELQIGWLWKHVLAKK